MLRETGVILFILLIIIAFTGSDAIGQETDLDDVSDKASDAFSEMSTGKLTLRFINALNGNYVEGAKVKIGDKTYSTDFEGKVRFKTPITNGALPVVFTKRGFITAKLNVQIMVGSIFQNRISVSPDIQPESIRIVLDWADRPRDLDAHLIKKGDYHVSYRNKKESADGKVNLDRDDRNGNGPETITLQDVDDNGVYLYKVEDYSNRRRRSSDNLATRSKATVRVYGESQLINEFRVPDDGAGSIWKVFTIKDGRIRSINEIN